MTEVRLLIPYQVVQMQCRRDDHEDEGEDLCREECQYALEERLFGANTRRSALVSAKLVRRRRLTALVSMTKKDV